MAGHGSGFGGAGIRRALLRWASPCVLALLLLLVGAAAASGDSLTFSSTPGHPSGLAAIEFSASSSTASTDATVTVSVDTTSETVCRPTPATDKGVKVIDGAPANSHLRSTPYTFEHGRYLMCGWLVDPTGTLAVHHATLSVSNPDKVSIAVPASVLDGTVAEVTLAGVADVQDPAVYVKRKPGANARCAASPAADRGQPLVGADPAVAAFGTFGTSASVALGAGPTGISDFAPPGPYTLCAWLVDAGKGTGATLAAPASAHVTLTAPTGTLAYSMPELIGAGHAFTLRASYTTTATDVRMYVDLKPLPAGGPPCAASHAEDRGSVKLVTIDTSGAHTKSRLKLGAGGVYVACAWLEWPHGTIDGPFAGRVVIANPGQRATLWFGITKQRLPRSKTHTSDPIVFQTIDGQVVNLSYWARYKCTAAGKNPSHPVFATSFPVFGMGSRGSFGDRFEQGTDVAVIGGRLKGRRGHGTFSESYTSDGFSCRSGTVKFKVRRA